MISVTITAPPGQLLWRTVQEANLLRDCLGRHVPDLLAWALLFDHVHLGCRSRDAVARVPVAMRAWALQRNRLRGETGPAWKHRDLFVREEKNRDGQRLLLRYFSLNPCRRGHEYVTDPLAWPWSSHRELVGLALDPLVRPLRDPSRFHEFVVSDPVFARWDDSHLPAAAPAHDRETSPGDIVVAVAALLRRSPGELREPGRPRRVLVGALCALTRLSQREIGRIAGVDRSTVARTPPLPPPAARVVRRVVGDPRFRPWTDRDLARLARRFHPGRA